MNHQRPGVGVVVDGYSSGSLFRLRLEALGYQVLHVQSRADMPSRFRVTVDPAYHANFIFDGNLNTLFEALAPYDVRLVIPGTDPGVVLASQIASRFNVASNPVPTARMVRDKFAVNEICRRAGLKTAEQCWTGSWEEAEAWIAAHGKWPVVVKPVSGSATHSVFLAHSLNEVKVAFYSIRNRPDVLGDTNEKVLLQEFLHGVEYFVDTVSSDGKHYVTDVFRYTKTKSHAAIGADIYDFDELLDPDGPDNEEVKRLIEYAVAVLDAVKYRFGASHLEIILTSDGPALVELNPRIVGGFMPRLTRVATDCDPIEMAIDAMLDPEAFGLRSRVYRMKQHARFVSVSSDQQGIVQSCPYYGEIQSLASCLEAKIASLGTHLVPTRDLTTVAGSVLLTHVDAGVVQSDYRKIREWEARGLFDMIPFSTQQSR